MIPCSAKRLIKLAAVTAWLGVAVSAASPADAKARTIQSGPYVLCSNYSYPSTANACGYVWNYQQNLQFVTYNCSSGACASDDYIVRVQAKYTVGRKVVYPLPMCEGQYLYDLGSCAC
jgi:hypothetical protein